MEYTPEGNLFKYLYEKKDKNKEARHFLSERQTLEWSLQVANGMEHLHNKSIVHRDLRSANVYLSAEMVAKISGFHLARFLVDTQEQSDECGTQRWMAPEVMQATNAKINQKCDIFSYAMFLYELFARKIPFEDIGNYKASVEIDKEERPQIPPNVRDYIQSLMQHCWAHKANDRPSFKEVKDTLQKHINHT